MSYDLPWIGGFVHFLIAMPTLNWIGKEAVVTHHQQVKFRPSKVLPRESLWVVLPITHGTARFPCDF